jgi:hypothetical protein
MTVSKKDGGADYEEKFKMGPMDPCKDDLLDPRKIKHQEYTMKHGNMSLHHVCPFDKV